MKITLSQHFTYKTLLLYTLPSIIMMVFSSVYSIVDGLFVSNYVGKLALSAVNIIFPVFMVVGALGFMLGAGGSAIVAKTLGEGDQPLARRYFSMIIYSIVVLGAVASILCIVFIRPLAWLVGASELIIEDCVTYGTILLAGSVPFMLQSAFQTFFVVAEKPHLGLIMTLIAGGTNILLDYIFIGVLGMGIAGAAYATVAGACIGGFAPLIYFFAKNKSTLRLGKTRFYGKQFLIACYNGSSELLSNISASVVSMLYNIRIMALLGESGVAAYSVMMYVDFVFVAIFLGFVIGSAPIVSYNYGSGNDVEQKSVFKKSVTIIAITSVVMIGLSEALAGPLSKAFVGYDTELLEMTENGFRLFALCYLFCGINIFASAYFTALGQGLLSALLSFARTLILRGGMVFVMPALFGTDGIWLAVLVAEALGAVASISCLAAKRKKLHYA